MPCSVQLPTHQQAKYGTIGKIVPGHDTSIAPHQHQSLPSFLNAINQTPTSYSHHQIPSVCDPRSKFCALVLRIMPHTHPPQLSCRNTRTHHSLPKSLIATRSYPYRLSASFSSHLRPRSSTGLSSLLLSPSRALKLCGSLRRARR